MAVTRQYNYNATIFKEVAPSSAYGQKPIVPVVSAGTGSASDVVSAVNAVVTSANIAALDKGSITVVITRGKDIVTN
jgi:hypothetical protein